MKYLKWYWQHPMAIYLTVGVGLALIYLDSQFNWLAKLA